MKQVLREVRLRKIPLEVIMAAKYQAALTSRTMERVMVDIITRELLAPKKKNAK
jgi:hypothetical protein